MRKTSASLFRVLFPTICGLLMGPAHAADYTTIGAPGGEPVTEFLFAANVCGAA